MEAVREAYADMHRTAEAVQSQLSELRATEKDLRRQLKSSTQQVCAAAMIRCMALASKEGPAVMSLSAGLNYAITKVPCSAGALTCRCVALIFTLSMVVMQCWHAHSQARASEESKTRSRLDKAERAIEQERAQNCALKDALQALQQVQCPLPRDEPHAEMSCLTVNMLIHCTHLCSPPQDLPVYLQKRRILPVTLEIDMGGGI
jgi:hypothetical protein